MNASISPWEDNASTATQPSENTITDPGLEEGNIYKYVRVVIGAFKILERERMDYIATKNHADVQ